jgi:predicted transposase/invertase (TIGR01784 family)
MKTEETFKNLTIKNDFLFGAVMSNPQKCKALLECILGIKIRKIEYPELQKTIDKAIGSKGIRLDIYVEDDTNTIYNIEIQTTDKKNLPKRVRYYQGMIDLNIIEKGKDFTALKKSYVIFICDYDEFGLGRHIYTFENVCREVPELKLGDDTVKIILNTKGTADDVNDDVKELLEYIGGSAPRSKLTKSLEEEVQKVKSSEEWRREYMTLFMRDRENRELGEALGSAKKVVSLVRKKKVRGLTPEDIAELLEEPLDYVDEICHLLDANPNLSDDEIAELLG